MRFENKHFIVIIERKKTETITTKVAVSKKKKWVPFAIGGAVFVMVVCGLLFFGPWKEHMPWNRMEEGNSTVLTAQKDGGGDATGDVVTSENNTGREEAINPEEEFDELPEGTYITSARLANNIRDKYQEETPYGYTYGEPIKDLKRDESIEIPIGFDLNSLEIEYWSEFAALYQDPKLQYDITPQCSYDEENKKVLMAPTNYPIGRISTFGLNTDEVTQYNHSEHTLFPHDAGTDWGNLSTMYLALYKDPETGKDLDTPIVRIVTMEGEIKEEPVLSFSISDDGRASFTWNDVEGAQNYVLCSIQYYTEYGIDGGAYPLVMTSETNWTYEAPEFDSYSTTNKDFKNFDMCENDWYIEYKAENASEDYGITEGVYLDTSFYADEGFFVIAINEDGTSMMSNIISKSEVASSLPYTVAYETSKEKGVASTYDTVEQISAYSYVTMCDGYCATKLIDYQTDRAEIVDVHYIEIDEEGNYEGSVDVPSLKIPYVIEGTPFEYVITVDDYDEVNLEKDLAFLDEREEKLRKKSGDITITGEVEAEDTEINISEEEIEKLQVREVSDVEITANCALSEYLATSMLGGATLIDLSAFPEADDPAFVDDAWREAYYQNPLILGVKGYRLNKNGTVMKVIYDENVVTTAGKQEEILKVIPQIIDSIITEDMTELEKELAINQYLCDTIVYDEDALLNAEQNDFMYVDDEFIDSFTAYGALIDGKCVCAGYAAAFKLLAEEAGLEAVVVTGILEGSLSHAWNKVQINGEWQILDVTNNDNEYLFNALLNLPDYAGDRVLVEDKDYVIDMSLDNYDSIQEKNEYYRINEKYFPYDEITDQLVKELTANGETVLRTEYDLNDDMFYRITDGIFEQMGDEIDLYGFYWMGVIYLSLSE